MAPERLWGDFYVYLLTKLESQGACFMNAMRVVKWFQKRRELVFKEVCFTKTKVHLSLEQADCSSDPPLVLRIYPPSERDSSTGATSANRKYSEIKLSHATEMEVVF